MAHIIDWPAPLRLAVPALASRQTNAPTSAQRPALYTTLAQRSNSYWRRECPRPTPVRAAPARQSTQQKHLHSPHTHCHYQDPTPAGARTKPAEVIQRHNVSTLNGRPLARRDTRTSLWLERWFLSIHTYIATLRSLRHYVCTCSVPSSYLLASGKCLGNATSALRNDLEVVLSS